MGTMLFKSALNALMLLIFNSSLMHSGDRYYAPYSELSSLFLFSSIIFLFEFVISYLPCLVYCVKVIDLLIIMN